MLQNFKFKTILVVIVLFLVSGELLVFSYIGYAQQDYIAFANTRIAKYNPPRKEIAIVIDYTKSIFTTRLFIIDVKRGKILLSSTVSHAWNSGTLLATKFSNSVGSDMSSKGVYLTGAKIISPKFGSAMLVRGLDKGVNNNAASRQIIFHSDRNMKTIWSNGCFATPENINKQIIDLACNGVLVCVLN